MTVQATRAFVGGWGFFIGGAGSPTVFTQICPVFSISGVGKTNELIDSTTFCSGGVKEYIPGLADGTEMAIEANYEPADTGLADFISAVNNKQTRDFQLVVTDGTTTKTFTLRAAALKWEIGPSVDNKNTISFSAKISGDILVS